MRLQARAAPEPLLGRHGTAALPKLQSGKHDLRGRGQEPGLEHSFLISH